MNPHFRKGGKAKQGSGHLWVLADYDKEEQLSQIHVQPTQHHDQPSVPQNGNQLGSNISVNPAVDVNEKVCPNSGSSLEEYGQQNRTLQVSYAFKFIYFEKDIESKNFHDNQNLNHLNFLNMLACYGLNSSGK